MPEYKSSYDRSHALIIAIDEYQHLPSLLTAVRGGNSVADLLQNSYGFETTTLFNSHASPENILGWLANLNCGIDDRVLIYFAGHGLTRKTPNRDIGYLGLYQTENGEYHSAIKMESMIEEAEILQAKHVLVLIDACFSGLVLTRSSSGSASDFNTKKVAEILISRPVRYVITAGGAEVVDDNAAPGGQYSIFTYYLLRGLRGDVPMAEGIIRAKQLANYLEERVSGSRRSRHKPNHGYLEGSEDGDFVFKIPDTLIEVADSAKKCKVQDPNQLLGGEDHKISLLQGLRKSTSLTLLERITIGQSESGVYLVDIAGNKPSNLDGLFFCKIYRTPTGEEKQTYDKVAKTKLGDYIPKLVDNTPLINGWMASLYEPAHQTTLRGSQSLKNLLRKNMLAAHDGILKMLDLLDLWNSPLSKRGNSDPYTLLRLPLQRFTTGSGTANIGVAERIESFISGLTGDTLELQFSKQALPNPTAFFSNKALWLNSRNVVWPKGHVHGDLHSNNVVFLMGQHNETILGNPVLIDFDTYQDDGCLFFDLAYLEIDLAMSMLDPTSLSNREIWPRVSQYLARSIQLQSYPPLETQAFPLISLLLPIRATVSKICDRQPGDFNVAYWISRASAGLSFARKRKVNSAQRKLSMLLAAESLDKAFEELDIQHTGEKQPFWMDWLDEQSISPTN